MGDGQGSKERRLPIGRNAVVWIEHWLDLRGLFGADEDALFLSKLGKRISARNVQKRFAEWGINRASTATCIRISCATFATHMLESSGDLRGCRSCWVMRICPPLKFIPILIFNTCVGVRCMHPRAKRGK